MCGIVTSLFDCGQPIYKGDEVHCQLWKVRDYESNRSNLRVVW